jgi:hypothetical protein
MRYQTFGLNSKASGRIALTRSLISLTVFGLAVLVAGCATSKHVKETRQSVKEAYELQKPILVQTSTEDERPGWTKNTVIEENGSFYFSGGFLDGADYSVSVRCANAEALKVAVQSVSQFIRAEFTEYVQGGNTGANGVERFVEDGLATFVEGLHLQGIRQIRVHYEKMFSAGVMQATYNVWVQLKMSKADYLRCKTDAMKRLRDRFEKENQEEAKEKAERLLNELKNEVKNEEGLHGV